MYSGQFEKVIVFGSVCETAAVVAAARPREPELDGAVEEERPVGAEPPHGPAVDRRDDVGRKPAAPSLVGERRVVEPVAQHEDPARERRLEDLGDVLPAVGLHEEELGKWVQPPRRGVEQDLPEPDADPGPSRLALENDVAPACAAELGRAARLRRLSGSFDSFERDEGHRKPIIDDEGFAGKRALRPRTPSGRGRMITGRP